MALVVADTLLDSLMLYVNIALISTFCPECSIHAIIGIIRWLSKLSVRKVHFF